MKIQRAGILPGVLAAFALGSTARASPLEDTTMGSSVFTGPAHAHASSIYLSPAALWLAGRGQHFYAGSTLRLDLYQIDRREVDTESGTLSDGASVSTSTLSPAGLIGMYSSVGDRFNFGASLHTPYSQQFIGQEEELRYHTLGGQMFQVLGTIAGCIAIDSRVAFGIAVSLGYSRFDLDLARDTALEAGSNDVRGIASDCGGSPCGVENAEAAQRLEIETHTSGLGGLFARKNVGATVSLAIQPAGDWWVVASLVSPPGSFVEMDLGGDIVAVAPPRDGGARRRGDAEIIFQTPQSVLVGIRGPLLPGWDLVAGGRWQNYSRHGQLDIRTFGGRLDPEVVPEWYPRFRGFRDVWRLEGGMERQEDAIFRYGARARVETGAVNATTVSPLQIEGFNVGAGAGAELRLAQYVVITASYDASWYPPLDSTQSAFDPRDMLACIDSNFDFDSCDAAREGRATPTAAGTYQRLGQSFALSIRYDNL